jgi:F-type H+-transporting ATPase subunit epsilon
MATPFHLQIVTPDGSEFDGQAVRIIVRTIAGDVCVMARHTNYCTALGMGERRRSPWRTVRSGPPPAWAAC